MYLRTYVFVAMRWHVYIYICTCMYTCEHVSAYVNLEKYVWNDVYVYMQTYVHEDVCVCKCTFV